jgi:protein-S-isoprenylcysteine O-methyltransferase Ste14
MLGTDLMIISPGSWTRDALYRTATTSASTSWGPYVQAFWLFTLAGQSLVAVSIFSNTFDEERVLRQSFGKHYDEWKVRTPYSLIPGVF